MPTLLVTKKMSPELAARVQASVEGRRRRTGREARAPRDFRCFASAPLPHCRRDFRLTLSLRRAHRELESQRAALLERVRRESDELSPDELAAPQRMLPWLALLSARYEGDSVADELRPSAAFSASIARPTVYVRGPLSSFGDASRVTESASGSFKDAFVLCLNAPPSERSEKLLRVKARAAYSGRGEEMKSTLHVQRLMDALVGLPYLGSEWESRVRNADSREALDKLQRNFERAPLDGARLAARARLLLFVMDEPSDKAGPSELDGERPHDVRVTMVDLVKREVLLRLRRRVDPGWVSPATRAEYANGVDSCALALDVRAAVSAGGPVAAGQEKSR